MNSHITNEGAEAFGVYMDYQASTPLDPRAFDAMRPFLTDGFGNPHATDHAYGWQADAAVSAARDQIASVIGADSDEIVFTSGATEANNLAVLGACRAAPADRRRVVVSAVEHKCVLGAARALEAEGFDVVVVPVMADGIVDLEALGRIVDSRTAMVSVMVINNEVGTRQPIEAVSALCQQVGALFHTDAAQALAVADVDVGRWDVDLLSLSAHKAYGPKGIGALYVRRSIRSRIRAIMFGGGQEDGLRPGTLPTFLCVGFGAACAILAEERTAEIGRIGLLRDTLLARVSEELPGMVINGTMASRHPGNLNLRIPGVEAELILAAARPRLAAATGSACTSGIPEPSHVLRAMGLDAVAANEAVRISLGRFTTAQDVEDAANALVAAAAEVRSQVCL